ncbi:MAG: Protein of unknown function (DUF3465) [Phormidesmis priestleyi Ana]|uniref:DUF3465 domain-containing protein n=1 Tax=Phormidesmis priestleyi Ana TaxID=1666911 RepID=A0A0P7ZY44_9CYAN|nr:MAG: Protein of unknown function (DUF3465) [Phormidesmis priestleyi Ana]
MDRRVFLGGMLPVLAAPSYLYRNSQAEVMGSRALLEAFKNQQSDVVIDNVSGTVESILPDDIDGDRHQRFIIRISRNQTVLVVHNIDMAPRISGLMKGDRVSVKGEYEWNDRGGLIHWTHKDPRNSHADGWIEYNRVRYE